VLLKEMLFGYNVMFPDGHSWTHRTWSSFRSDYIKTASIACGG